MTTWSLDESARLDERAVNLAHWEALAAMHGEGQEGLYDVEAIVAGQSSLLDWEEEALAFAGGVAGKAVMHLQCHLGFDAICFARQGAQVTGVDFSPTALAKAAVIAQRAGVQVAWREADATKLPADLQGAFDVVYASIGAIAWIGDMGAWMRAVHGVLKPGGHLLLVDLHPLYCMFGSKEPLVVDFPYSFDGPRAFTEKGSYAKLDDETEHTSINHAHDLGELVSTAVQAGLQVKQLREHLSCSFDPLGRLAKQEEDGRFRFRLGDGPAGPGYPLPMLFTLVAAKP